MEVFETTQYDIFRTVTGNRKISRPHVEELCRSIDKKNLLPNRPLIVNERMEVIDGQHRLEAAKRLDLPIYYIVCALADYEDVAILNNCQDNWGYIDYLNMYARQGYPDYIKLEEFLKKHNMTTYVCLPIFTRKPRDTKIMGEIFKKGEFKFEVSEGELDLLFDRLNKLRDMHKKSFFGGGPQKLFSDGRTFFKAFVFFHKYHADEIDWTIFFQHLGIKMDQFITKATVAQYYDLLVAIYNWRRTANRLTEHTMRGHGLVANRP